jgi:alpha-L-arabinofuranosidase
MKRPINRRRFLQLSATMTAAATVGSTSALTSVMSSPAFAATGLVGYWKFDEGIGTSAADSSGSGYTATLQSGAAWASGQIGPYALAVSGANDSYVEIPNAVVNTAASFSVAAWVNVNAVTGGYQTFVSLNGSNVSAFFLQLRGDTGLFSFTRLGGDSTSTSTTTASAATPPTPGVWYHLVGVYDATAQTIALYVNGSLQQTLPYTGGWQGNGHTGIGRGWYGGGPVDFVNGQIDDVRFYNSALSAKSATDLAAVGYWNFDEGKGSTAADATGNSYTATLQSGVLWATGKGGGSALDLTGASNSYAEVPFTVVNTAASFSVAAWVNVTTISGNQTFVSLDGNNVSAFFLQLRADTGKFAFTRLASDSTSALTSVALATAVAVAGTWYHLAGVYNATAQTLALYVNGVLQQTITYTGGWQGSGHAGIGRGRYFAGPVDFVNGLIDDVHFYNVALDYTTINTLITSAPVAYPALTVEVDQTGPAISPLLYGLMFEDINHSGDGGLYAELIRNRTFQDNPNAPDYWSVVSSSGASGSIALDTSNPANTVALTTSLKLQITSVGAGQRVGVANTGFWGIAAYPATKYHITVYAKASADFSGPLTLTLESNDGTIVYGLATLASVKVNKWQKYTATFTTAAGSIPTETNRFVISASNTGTVWFGLVSLFGSTWNGHTNGLRHDLMQLLSKTNATFLRFPGGNYLEGNTTADYFPWKKTIGDIALRPGHQDPWGYRSSDGLGLLEYLIWCEDLNLSPLLAVYAGYVLNGTHIPVGTPAFNQIIQDAVDEIQYATGDVTTTWGAVRAADGHPAPFNIQYVEIGNEDFLDGSGSYDSRFTALYDAIKAAYPSIKLIATSGVSSRVPDVYDQHFYHSPTQMANYATLYNTYSRTAPKIFVGEYASQEGYPTPDLNSALGDAAFLTGLERNSDVVVLSSYAPLLANVNALNWGTNLIGFDALNSYGSPSYYVMGMFSQYHGNAVVPTQLSGVGGLYFVSSKNTTTGAVYIKVVNPGNVAQTVHIQLNSGKTVAATGTAVVLSSANATDTNTLSNPTHIAPVKHNLKKLSASFSYTFAPYSITALEFTVS